MSNKFTYKSGLEQITARLDKVARPLDEWTKYELHRYMTVKLKITTPSFDAFVGDYDADLINIEGYSISKAQAYILMKSMMDKGNVGGMPFTKLVQSNAEVAVSPMQYTVTDKMGTVKSVPMVKGLPSTEPTSVVIAHQNITFSMMFSTPERQKKAENGKTERKMVGSVATDPEGSIYLPQNTMSMVDELRDAYIDASNILDVRARLINNAKESNNVMDVGAVALQTVNATVDFMKNKGTFEPRWSIFDCIKEVDDPKTRAIYEQASVPPLQMVPHKVLPRYQIKSMNELYSFIEMHRLVRGSDSGKISPLTHAVYYGETDHYYRQITASADIQHIMTTLDAGAVTYTSNQYFSKAWTLLQLNVPVFQDLMSIPEYGGEEFGVYRCPTQPNITVLNVDCVSVDPPKKNQRTGLWEYTPTPEVCQERITKYFGTHTTCAIKVYAYPELWEQFPECIYPSLHAHSGIVWVVKGGSSPYKIEDHIARVTKANALKTYYPCLLRKAAVGDLVAWPTVYLKRSTKRVVAYNFEVMFEPVEEEEEEFKMDFGSITTKQREVAQVDVLRAKQQGTVVAFDAGIAQVKQDQERRKQEEELRRQQQDQVPPQVNRDAIIDGLQLEPDGYE